MHSSPQVLLDGALVAATDARVAATGEGFLYGHGVFETIKVTDGRPAFLPQHHARLTASAAALDLPVTSTFDSLRERIQRVVVANAVTEGSAKVVLFHNGAASTGELILTRTGAAYAREHYARGFRLKTVFTGERTGALSQHKTLNYLGNIRAKRAALAQGFDEPLLMTPAGIVIEGATTNVFIVRDGVALTPALACGPLPGIARAQALSLLGSGAREALITADDIAHASEVFVTNALLGVMPVCQVDERPLDLSNSPVTQILMAAYRARETQSLS